MGPPVWLLDVDGVINADRPGWSAAPRRSTAYAKGQGWRMRWAPALVDRIRVLHRAGLVEVRWCTTWCPYADQLERLWALPPLVRALTDDPIPGGERAVPLKLATARAVLDDERRRLVWTDDIAVPGPGPLYDELTAGGRAVLIAPDERRGLQPVHMEEIERFCVESTHRQPTDPARLLRETYRQPG